MQQMMQQQMPQGIPGMPPQMQMSHGQGAPGILPNMQQMPQGIPGMPPQMQMSHGQGAPGILPNMQQMPQGIPGMPSQMQMSHGQGAPGIQPIAQQMQPGIPGMPHQMQMSHGQGAPGIQPIAQQMQPGIPGMPPQMQMSEYETSGQGAPGIQPNMQQMLPGIPPQMQMSHGAPGIQPYMQQMPPGIPGMPPQMQMTPGAPGMQMQPQMPYGAMQPQMQQQKPKLDPEMMPSVVQVVEDDRGSRSGPFPTGYPTAELPPLVTTEYFAQDQGNSNPKFMRSTLYTVPQNSDMLKASQLPLSLAITPIARLHPSEYPPPVVDLGEIGPVRCQRCKAYICPFMEFIDGGRKFRCPFCRASSTIEDAYFAHLDHTGRRTDIQYRPELCLGSYEFVATKEYCKNNVKPKEPAFIFMLDVSYNAVRSGLVELFCSNIVDLLRNLPKDYGMDKSMMKIGLATYDQVIHFYNLSQRDHSEMLIVNDVNDIFVPFVEGFLIDFQQAENSLIGCLKEIVNNFLNTRITETILGPVIQAGLDALKSSDRVGKLFIFHTSLPTFEAPGQLKNRDDRKLLGTDKEKTVLSPGSEFYTKLGEQCIQVGCAVDLFFFPNAHVEIASIVPVANISGGSIYKYQYFDAERDGSRFLADLSDDISRDIAFDVMLRLRTSTGIRPTGFYGNFYMQNTTDIEMGALDCEKSVQIEIKYDDKLDEKENAYFQVAILFTSCSGQRRLRIHNLALPVTADYNQVYRLTDEDSLLTHLFKQAEQIVREKSPKEMREEVVQRCARILATYREKCSESAPMGQLILPECSKLLPLHGNCLLKTDALNGGSELTVDDRAWMMHMVPCMTPEDVSYFLYPRVYPITGLVLSEQQQQISLPIQVRASFEYFSSNEAYLMENGLVAFIWVGLNVPKEWLQAVFNVSSPAKIDSEKHVLPERENPHSRALRELFSLINKNRPRHLKLFVIKEQDGLESWMKKFLVEDRYGTNTHSYVDFLCQLHREIRSLLS